MYALKPIYWAAGWVVAGVIGGPQSNTNKGICTPFKDRAWAHLHHSSEARGQSLSNSFTLLWQHQHMQTLLQIRIQPPQAHTTKTSGKSPDLYQFISCIKLVDRKHTSTNTLHQITKKMENPPLLSPHTRVCGKRWTHYKTNKTPNMKTKPTTIITQTPNAMTNSKHTSISKNISHTHPQMLSINAKDISRIKLKQHTTTNCPKHTKISQQTSKICIKKNKISFTQHIV